MAATWDEELLAASAPLLAGEARRKGVDVVLGADGQPAPLPAGRPALRVHVGGPVADGPDRAAYVSGVQARASAPARKHYVANDAETDRSP